MASKLAKAAMMAGPMPHTAGLFSDISVDGPEIGTLVVIVDRARNLPNRKTMGKQDAYCAARLGKEAKKTETDRRGGQTPKWDQELRFVVHDGLDYHQLKVSVFSEDRRTDLIGECWVPLDPILIAGGGKNDAWHPLNFKNKNAGEIRVELTFYDSRPREAKAEDVPPPRDERGMKAVKRRPLPADPTASGNASPVSWHGPRPLPGTAPVPSPAPSTRSQEVPPPQRQEQAVPMQQDRRPRSELHFNHHSDVGIGSRSDLGTSTYNDRAYTNYQPSVADDHEEPDFNYNASTVSAPATYGGIELPELPPHTPRSHRSSAAPTPKYYTPVNSSPAYVLPQYERTPEAESPLARSRAGTGRSYQNEPSPLRTHSMENVQPPHQLYQDSRPRHHSETEVATYGDHVDLDAGPPPPPRHSRASSIPQGQPQFSQPQAGYAPSPLNIRRPGSSSAASPLRGEYNPQEDHYDQIPEDSHMSTALTLSAPVTANHTPSSQRFQSRQEPRGSVEPLQQYPHDAYSTPPNRRHQPYIPPNQASSYGYDQNRHLDSYKQTHPIVQSIEEQEPEYYQDQSHPQQYANREGAPIAKPRAISPAARTPMRKSVSPRPSIASEEPSLRGVAFSPDSFDQFNPNLGSNPTSAHGTPETSRHGSRAPESPTKADGPIIGSDGRVIDPSDHLPSDTWAPEPEKKSPRKSHQINVKFRHIPQSTSQRPSPTQPRPLPQVAGTLRPLSMVPQSSPSMSPSHQTQYAQDDTMSQASGSGGRNRLQKRPPSHIQSSPSPHQHRMSPSTQPLRENPNYGSPNVSPSHAHGNSNGHARHSFSSAPPPVPAKIPMAMEQEDYRPHHYQPQLSHEYRQDGYGMQQQSGYQQPQQHYSAQNGHYSSATSQGQYGNSSPSHRQNHSQALSLSEEMSRIDIGSGGGGRTRRNQPVRYGY